MSIVYTFTVHSLTKKTVNDVPDTVVAVVWERSGHDENGYSGSSKMRSELDVSQVGVSKNYTEFSNLTKKEVKSWIPEKDMERSTRLIAAGIERSREHEELVEKDSLPWEV